MPKSECSICLTEASPFSENHKKMFVSRSSNNSFRHMYSNALFQIWCPFHSFVYYLLLLFVSLFNVLPQTCLKLFFVTDYVCHARTALILFPIEQLVHTDWHIDVENCLFWCICKLTPCCPEVHNVKLKNKKYRNSGLKRFKPTAHD